MIVLIDMDGPIAGFDAHVWVTGAAAGLTFDVEGPEHQRHRYSTHHMPAAEARRLRREHIDQPGWFRSLPVVDGAQAGVEAMLSANLDVWVCTKPLEVNPTCRDEKAAWLAEHFPMLGDRKLIVAPDKSMVVGNVLLDDAPKPSWFGRALWRPVIYSCPYNGPGSEWADLPRWTWADGMEAFFDAALPPGSARPRLA